MVHPPSFGWSRGLEKPSPASRRGNRKAHSLLHGIRNSTVRFNGDGIPLIKPFIFPVKKERALNLRRLFLSGAKRNLPLIPQLEGACSNNKVRSFTVVFVHLYIPAVDPLHEKGS